MSVASSLKEIVKKDLGVGLCPSVYTLLHIKLA